MTEKDLFNAINEIDAKYITDAWQNTEAQSFDVESGKTSRLKIFGTVAAFAAAAAAICLVVHIRVNSPGGFPQHNNSLIVHSPSELLPADIHGPDEVRITYGDVTEVTNEDGGAFSADEITADNWQRIVCEGFTYLAMPLNGENYNSIDNPSMFDGTLDASRLRLDSLSYTRWNVGDTFHGLTVKSASTAFQYHYKGEPIFTPSECTVEFDGTASVDGYIMYDNDGNLICVPMYGESFLPFLYPCEELKFGSKNKIGDFEFNTAQSVFYLDNDNNLDIDRILEGKTIAKVTLTVSDVRMSSIASVKVPNYVRATVDEIDEYVPGDKLTGELPFELYGADNVQIRYEDIGHINFEGTLPVIPGSSLTADNWESIYCYDFGYITQPTGKNFNSIDNPEMFDADGNLIDSGDILSEMGKHERINVGDKFGGLTLREATTIFANKSAVDERFDSCLLHFEGTIGIDAYLVRRPETKQVFCVPRNGETPLPLLMPFATRNDGTFLSPWFMGRYRDENIVFCTELPYIGLHIPDEINLDDYLALGECKLVNLTLDNIQALCTRNAEYSSAITAHIVSINEISDNIR